MKEKKTDKAISDKISFLTYFLLIILSLSCILISCRDKQLSQDELSNKFNEDWCDCLAKQSEGKTPEEIVEQVAVNCVLNVLSRYTKDKQLHDNILSLVAEKGYDDSLSDYEKEKLFGKELGKNLMADAIDYCVVYRQSLIQFKKNYIEKARQEMNDKDEHEVNELINMMRTELDAIDISQINTSTKKQISNYYLLLGLLYENMNKEHLAIEQYDNAIQFDSESTIAIGFKKMLVKYKNNEMN